MRQVRRLSHPVAARPVIVYNSSTFPITRGNTVCPGDSFWRSAAGSCPPRACADDTKPADQPAKFAIPYKLTDTKHVLVRAKINGKGPFNMILDTGAPAVFITKPLAKKVGRRDSTIRAGVRSTRSRSRAG